MRQRSQRQPHCPGQLAARLRLNRIPNEPRPYASLLRRELSARNASYAAQRDIPHVTSYGQVPTIVYHSFDSGEQHGNFIPASYRGLLRRPQWRRKLEKVHSQGDRCVTERRLRLEGTRFFDELGCPVN